MTGPRPFSTHGITLGEGIAVKRFRTNVDGDERRLHGDEPRREWRALELLARYAPGLAPKPIRADLDADSPLIAMSQVPGEPLGMHPVTKAQEDAIAGALSRLHHAIPAPVLATVEPAPGSPQLLVGRIRDMARACDPGATELADFVEHVTVWAHAGIDAEAFLDRFDLHPGERQQVTQLRRLFAAFWVMRLRPGGRAYQHNPPGTFERQAARLLGLLGSA
jgi:hypothetical protein